jgi:dynein heavy chain 1
METVRTYLQTVDRVNAYPTVAPLIAEFRSNTQDMIVKGMSYRWEHFTSFMSSTPSAYDSASSGTIATREGRHAVFVKEFASAVSIFQDRCDALVEMSDSLEKIVDELSTCSFEADVFANLLAEIQKMVGVAHFMLL